jgi:hypothetical protein
MSTPMPGWYPDPESPGRQRFWDGQQWTEARAYPASDVGATQPAATTQSSGNGAWPWVVGLIVLGAILLGAAFLLTRPTDTKPTPTPTVTTTATATATATATETETQAPPITPSLPTP